LRELELAVKEKDEETATNLFRHLCQETAAERQLLDLAIAPMDWNPMNRQVERVLDESLDIPTANPVVGEVWAERRIKRREYDKCRQRLESSSERYAVWYRAAATYLYQVTQDKRMTDADKFIQNNAAALRADNDTWGLVGHALYELGRYPDVVEWLSDWRSRISQPWVLLNYVLALRELNRDAEAYEAGQAALQLTPDELSDAHRALLALDDALANNTETAAEQLRQIRYEDLRVWDKFTHDTAVAIIEAARSPRPAIKPLWKLASLRRANPSFWKDKLLFNWHWRATLKIAESTDNLVVKAWAYLVIGGLYLKRSIIQAQNCLTWKRGRV
jgi:tetratricopeptide (TPR) repeat protein